MRTDLIKWDREPQKPTRLYVPIFRAVPHGRLKLVALGDGFEGVWCHWRDGRSEPCFGRENECPGCRERLPKRWYGYLGCLEPTYGRVGLAETTLSAMDACKGVSPKGAATLRGLVLTIWRNGKHERSPLVMQLEPEPLPEGLVLPPCPDVAQALLRIWGLLDKAQVDERLAPRLPPPDEIPY